MFEPDDERQKRIGAAVKRLMRPDCRITSLQFFTDNEVTVLRDSANRQDFRLAQKEVTYQGRTTFQDFDVCFPAPRCGIFDDLATCLETSLWFAGQEMPENPFFKPFRFDDFAIQRYPVDSRGIGIHRDGQRYRYVVIIICLDGQSRLFSCIDRFGSDKRLINDRPGRMVLLSAPGFLHRDAEDARSLHGVDRVNGGRLSLGFRVSSSA